MSHLLYVYILSRVLLYITSVCMSVACSMRHFAFIRFYRWLIRTSMLLFFFFLLFSLGSVYLHQHSPVPAATTPQPMPHKSRLHGQLLSHSPSPPCWEVDLFSAAQDTTTRTTTPHPSLPQLSWRFSRVRPETWHLSYACIWAPSSVYLAHWLRQL